VGKFATRHLGGFGPGYRSAYTGTAKQKARTKGIVIDFFRHVENDFWAIYSAAYSYIRPQLCWDEIIPHLGQQYDENYGVQHFRLVANLQRNQLPTAR